MQGDFELKGNKISLVPTTIEDMIDYERWNDPTLKAFQYDGPWYKNDDNHTKMIEKTKKIVKSGLTPPYRFLEIYTAKDKHIGSVSAGHNVNDPHATEIGIAIWEDQYWGKGLGAEALTLWIDYLFKEMDLTRIGFTTWQGNPMMIGLGKKLGFVEEARIRRSCLVKGLFYDRIMMGILREEWEAKRSDFKFIEQH